MNKYFGVILYIALIVVLLFTLSFSAPPGSFGGEYNFYKTVSSVSSTCENNSDYSAINDCSVIHSHENSSMKIALTFDDGPSSKYTAKILDILKKHNVKATFFVIGENAVRYPELVIREIEEGHEIGNHTYSHRKITALNDSAIQDEISYTEEIIYEIYDYRPSIFRPPEGQITDRVVCAAKKLDYSIIMWNIDTRDWAHTPVNDIVNNVLVNIKSGDIILFHDFVSKMSPTPEALEKIIPVLIERGYNFVTVSELIGSE